MSRSEGRLAGAGPRAALRGSPKPTAVNGAAQCDVWKVDDVRPEQDASTGNDLRKASDDPMRVTLAAGSPGGEGGQMTMEGFDGRAENAARRAK